VVDAALATLGATAVGEVVVAGAVAEAEFGFTPTGTVEPVTGEGFCVVVGNDGTDVDGGRSANVVGVVRWLSAGPLASRFTAGYEVGR
jgi:hypothetical protein